MTAELVTGRRVLSGEMPAAAAGRLNGNALAIDEAAFEGGAGDRSNGIWPSRRRPEQLVDDSHDRDALRLGQMLQLIRGRLTDANQRSSHDGQWYTTRGRYTTRHRRGFPLGFSAGSVSHETW